MDKVRIPQDAAEAEAMMRVASHWLETNAPDLLRGMLRATKMAEENEAMRAELRWYGEEASAIASNCLLNNTTAMMASMQVLALDGGKRAAKYMTPNAELTAPTEAQRG